MIGEHIRVKETRVQTHITIHNVHIAIIKYFIVWRYTTILSIYDIQGVATGFTQTGISHVNSRDNQIKFFILASSLGKCNFVDNSLLFLGLIFLNILTVQISIFIHFLIFNHFSVFHIIT